MNILDENVLEGQKFRLAQWHISVHQIGNELGHKGMSDDEIISLLARHRQPTFFTLDSDFFKRTFCHRRYGLVFLDVDELETALFIRRFLRHHKFDTHAKRMGVVVRVSHTGIDVWHLHIEQTAHYDWIA